MSTSEDLRRAIAMETANRAAFLAFAERAEAHGMPQVARLFRAVAESEAVHARRESQLLSDLPGEQASPAPLEAAAAPQVGSTVENLKRAVAAEEREFQDLYARFLREAQGRGDHRAARVWGQILKVERGHRRLFYDALVAVLDGEDAPASSVFVCRACGNTVVGEPQDDCSVCAAPADGFTDVP